MNNYSFLEGLILILESVPEDEREEIELFSIVMEAFKNSSRKSFKQKFDDQLKGYGVPEEVREEMYNFSATVSSTSFSIGAQTITFVNIVEDIGHLHSKEDQLKMWRELLKVARKK